MKPYVTNDASFNVDPAWEDQSIHAFSGEPGPDGVRFALVVSREPLGDRDPAEYMEKHVAGLAQRLRRFEMLGWRPRTLGGLSAYQVRASHVHQGKGIFQSQVFVHYYEHFLVFTVTDALARREEAEAKLEEVLADVKFRER